MIRRKLLTPIGILLFLIICGCSQSLNPIVNNTLDYQAKSLTNLPVMVSDFDNYGFPSGGSGITGLFSLEIDSDSQTAILNPLRSNQSTDVLEAVDITNFMSMFPCTDCVKIFSVELNSDDHIVVNIGIRHPFPSGNPSQPISGKNRADLHVFNVEGTLIATAGSSINFPTIGKQTGNFRLLNADGYSTYIDKALDPIFPTQASIHPYILHFDNYSPGNFSASNPMGFQSVTSPPPSGNLVMPMGSQYDIKPYIFDLSGGNIRFLYAVVCTYAVSSDSKSKRFIPVYRIPQHLKKSASEISVQIVENNLESEVSSSDAQIEIDVVDPNHGVSVGNQIDQMFHESSVASISLEIPGLFNGRKTVPLTNFGGSGHNPIDPLKYRIAFQNEKSAIQGTYLGLAKITDSYPPGLNSSQLLAGKDGIKRVPPSLNPLSGLFVLDEFATYQLFEIGVSAGALQCEDSPFGGVTFTNNFIYQNYHTWDLLPQWDVWSDQIIDAEILSDGRIACIYSDGFDTGDGTYDGELRLCNPLGSSFTKISDDYPGSIGISIDIDSEDNIIFVTSDLPHTDFYNNNAHDVLLSERVAAAYDYFYVINPITGIPSEKIINVGTPIMSVEIDEFDDVWVLDSENVMRKFIKDSNYAEDTTKGFDLDAITTGSFTGLVYDFVIDFHNDAFFVLSNETVRTNLWRFECDGRYLSDINGSPNPMINVLPHDTWGVADIAIDNYDMSGNILDGEQDSQIIVVGAEEDDRSLYDAMQWYSYYTSMVVRVNSELSAKVTSQRFAFVGVGFTNCFFDQATNNLWGFSRGVWSDTYTCTWAPPADWY